MAWLHTQGEHSTTASLGFLPKYANTKETADTRTLKAVPQNKYPRLFKHVRIMKRWRKDTAQMTGHQKDRTAENLWTGTVFSYKGHERKDRNKTHRLPDRFILTLMFCVVLTFVNHTSTYVETKEHSVWNLIWNSFKEPMNLTIRRFRESIFARGEW